MLLAGIDEAGYGPLLGPLVVAASAFDIPDGDLENPPCLWQRLSTTVSRGRAKSAKKLYIDDSKRVHAGAHGLRDLERGVLCASQLLFGPAESLQQLLQNVAGHCLDDLARHRWYDVRYDQRFPLEQDGLSLKLYAQALVEPMERARCQLQYFQARVLPERALNELFDKTRNKGSALFSIAAILLDQLLNAAGSRPCLIVCDRQGGRSHYGQLLRLMFPQWSLTIQSESESMCDYRLSDGPRRARIIFTEKAESQSLPVALASMLAKYLREALMARFNRFWLSHNPNLTPTAGYYTDGRRFLDDIQSLRQTLGISDAHLIRSR